MSHWNAHLLTEHDEYVLVTCSHDTDKSGGCNIRFAMPRWFYDRTHDEDVLWVCPQGHKRYWGGDSTRKKLKRAEARERHLRDQLQAAEFESERRRRTIIRERTRVANGVCPCCNRSFTNVRRHMATKHPDFDIERVNGPSKARCSCGRTFDTPHGLAIHQGHRRREGWESRTGYQAHKTVVA